MQDFEITQAPLEIERKYLISFPDIKALKSQPGYRMIHIEQTYLKKIMTSLAAGSAVSKTRDLSGIFILVSKRFPI